MSRLKDPREVRRRMGRDEKTGDIISLDTMLGWTPNWFTWKSWEDVPPALQAYVAGNLFYDSLERAAIAARVGGHRPNQVRYESMIARVFELAARQTGDLSLDPRLASPDKGALPEFAEPFSLNIGKRPAE